MRITIETELTSHDKINALITIARIFELSEQSSDDAPDLPYAAIFWPEHFPRAIRELFGSIQYLVTAPAWDKEDLRTLVDKDEWRSAISMVAQEIDLMKEMMQGE